MLPEEREGGGTLLTTPADLQRRMGRASSHAVPHMHPRAATCRAMPMQRSSGRDAAPSATGVAGGKFVDQFGGPPYCSLVRCAAHVHAGRLN